MTHNCAVHPDHSPRPDAPRLMNNCVHADISVVSNDDGTSKRHAGRRLYVRTQNAVVINLRTRHQVRSITNNCRGGQHRAGDATMLTNYNISADPHSSIGLRSARKLTRVTDDGS